MSTHTLLSQNLTLAYFTLDITSNTQPNPLLHSLTYPTMIHHHHYPIVYFEELYEHFRHCLPEGTRPGNLRVWDQGVGQGAGQGRELPCQMPIGLYLGAREVVNLVVKVQLGVCLLDGFKVVKNSWKKAFEVINPNRQCDYVKSRLSKTQLQQKYALYKKGRSHNLQNQGLYQGAFMIVKGLSISPTPSTPDITIQRKYSVTQYPKMRNIVQQLFCLSQTQMQQLQRKQQGGSGSCNVKKNRNIRVLSHTLDVDLEMSSKVFLDQWSYNDGYCYLVIEGAGGL